VIVRGFKRHRNCNDDIDKLAKVGLTIPHPIHTFKFLRLVVIFNVIFRTLNRGRNIKTVSSGPTCRCSITALNAEVVVT
jgi:hypothetical protein